MFVRRRWKQTEENLRKVIKRNREGNGANLRGCVARRVVTGGESAQAVTSGEGQGVEPEYGPSGSWESSSAEGLVSGWATERARWTSVRCVIS